MTATKDPDRQIHAFLLEGEEELHDQVYDAVRAAIEQKRQRVAIGPWRTPIMNKIVGFGLAAAAVVAVLLIGSQLIGSPAGGLGAGPVPTATPEPSPTPEPSVAEPTSTPEAGLPQGPYEFDWEGYSDRAPRITVSIPAPGWNTIEAFGVIQKGEEVDTLPEAAIISFPEPAGTAFYVYGDPCQWESTRPDTPATTVDEIVAALQAQASRDASEPVALTVGGYAGQAITLHVPDDASFVDCEGGVFASFGTESDELARTHQGPGQIDELWILDVDGAIVIIDAMYRPDTPVALIGEMRSIAESATFELP
jgi:hypothetical protein